MRLSRIENRCPDSHIVAGENIDCASDKEAQGKAREATRNGAAKRLTTNYCVVRLRQAPMEAEARAINMRP